MKNDDADKLATLLRESQAGDARALHLLCKRLEGYLHGYFKKRFQDDTIADDLCQDTYVRFLNNIHSIKDGMKLRGFVTKVALHVTQDYLREKYRKKERSLALGGAGDESGIQYLRAMLDEELSGSQHDVKLLNKIDLENALAQLPDKARLILMMKAEGYNYQEISHEMAISVSAVKMQIKRSLELLRKTLSM